MDFLTTLAQTSYRYSESSTALGAGTAAVIGLGFIFFFLILLAGAYVFGAICIMRIFAKAGVPTWAAWVPVYNNWKILEIGGQQGFWAVLAFIPLVNIVSAVFMIISMYHIGQKLGKGGEFVLWAIFLPIVWIIWLAFDKSTWNDSASSAPSLHRP